MLTLAAGPRTVFIQLFEWPWKDIKKECVRNLGPNGYAAVQVSPPQEHVVWENSPWWERYQPISYKLFSRSGDELDFKEMVEACNNAGVDVYVDVVFNHMAGIDEGHGIAGSTFTHYNYDGLFSYNDFHHCNRNGNNDIIDFSNLYELQNCELVNLADLKTESTSVQNKIATYLNKLISMGVKGFRVDAAKHIPAKDIEAIKNKLISPVYIVQELITSGNDPFTVDEYVKIGDVSAYAYPYFVGQAFKSSDFSLLQKMFYYMPDSMDSVVFLDNHDLQRAENRSMLLSAQYDKEVFDLAQVFMLTYPFGYPQLYSSYSFKNYNEGPPVNLELMTLPVLNSSFACKAPFICEHRRPYVNSLINFRNKTDKNFYITNWWTNGKDQLSFSRGALGFVMINNSNNEIVARSFQTGLKEGLYCNIISQEFLRNKNSCSVKIKVDSHGFALLNVEKMSAVVLLSNSL